MSRDRFPVVSLGIFSVVPPTEPCVLRSAQPLKMRIRDFSWGKGSRCVWLTTYHPCSAETSRKSGALIYPKPLGSPRPVAGDLYLLTSLTYKGGGVISCSGFIYRRGNRLSLKLSWYFSVILDKIRENGWY